MCVLVVSGFSMTQARLAQSVEHQTFNLRVAGSSPSSGGEILKNEKLLKVAHLERFSLVSARLPKNIASKTGEAMARKILWQWKIFMFGKWPTMKSQSDQSPVSRRCRPLSDTLHRVVCQSGQTVLRRGA